MCGALLRSHAHGSHLSVALSVATSMCHCCYGRPCDIMEVLLQQVRRVSRGAAKPKRVVAAPADTALERASEEDASDTMVRSAPGPTGAIMTTNFA